MTRPTRSLRNMRPGPIALGAAMLATPASAVALAAGQPDTQGAIQINVSATHVAYGGTETVTGSASRASAGRSVSLQFLAAGGSAWQTLQTTAAGSDGGFRFRARMRQSGRLRVVPATGSSRSFAGDPRPEQPSRARSVSVGSRLGVPTHSFNVLSGHAVKVGGGLLPALRGRQVVLLGRRGRSWHRLASTHTGAGGRFELRYTPGGLGHDWLRVEFAGDSRNTRSHAYAGQVTVYRQSLASWYNDAGATACGFHAYYGVANVSLPCGTHVRFRYGGRSVTAVVDDRGPYVGGRQWDLNQNSAAALGFSGVDTVWSSA